MLKIQEIITTRLPGKSQDKKGKPNSARADAVEQLCLFMGENPAGSMKYWLGRTRHLSPNDILDTIRQAKEGREPKKLFNWLLKQSHAKK